MSDTHTHQNKPEYLKYRYSIPQLLELSGTACLLFDLSKFTYDAARAGVIPSLDNCAMSSRKSSASYTKAAKLEASSTVDVLIFQGNRAVQPGRQPKLPPPIERQKDEGFAKFLKKHASPTHNRVTAGGRIVPMEPRSPPFFALTPESTYKPQTVSEDGEIRNTKRNTYPGVQGNGNLQQHEDIEFHPGRVDGYTQNSVLHPTAARHDTMMPVLFSQQAANGFGNIPVSAGYAPGSSLVPTRAYVSDHQMGGPVVLQPLQAQPFTYNPYHSPTGVAHTIPSGNDFGSSPSWPTFEHNFVPHDQAQHMLSAYQTLIAFEQHYVDLDLQLKNIDRHRAMHQLDPYLAQQRKEIVQQRSDAKDVVREFQTMLGVRRLIDSSQDSFTTSFNVDAPAYVPGRFFDSTDSMAQACASEPARNSTSTDKPEAKPKGRAIPIVSPLDRCKQEDAMAQQRVAQDITLQVTNEVDEWGIQKRQAPPGIQKEQSKLSDMLQAEQQQYLNNRDDTPQYISDSQSSDQSHQGVSVSTTSGVVDLERRAVSIDQLQSAAENAPRDTAEEMQKVVDAIGKPKGTVTRVRMLDNRVISIQGQGLDLSSIAPQQHSSRNSSLKADTRRPNPSVTQAFTSRDILKDDMAANQMVSANMLPRKENMLVAPRGHQKAATDAFLAQFNAVEDNVALASRPETRSLRTASNGLVEDRRYSGNHPPFSIKLPPGDSIVAKFSDLNLSIQQEMAPYPVADDGMRSMQTMTGAFSDDLLNKGYSSVSVQNINAVGRLPQNLDGTADARLIAQSHLAAAGKAKSPRFLRRHGTNGGAWYGPYCREVFERARPQSNAGRSSKAHAP